MDYRKLKAVMTSGVSAGAKGLYGYLLSYADQEGECWPGREKIMGEMRISKNTLHAYIQELVKAGFLTVARRGARTNKYTIK